MFEHSRHRVREPSEQRYGKIGGLISCLPLPPHFIFTKPKTYIILEHNKFQKTESDIPL